MSLAALLNDIYKRNIHLKKTIGIRYFSGYYDVICKKKYQYYPFKKYFLKDVLWFFFLSAIFKNPSRSSITKYKKLKKYSIIDVEFLFPTMSLF